MAETKLLPVAAVVGVGPGLGASLARRFAKGYAVAIVARRLDYLQSLAGEIRAAGGQVLEVPADVGDRTQIESASRLFANGSALPKCCFIMLEAARGATSPTSRLNSMRTPGGPTPMAPF